MMDPYSYSAGEFSSVNVFSICLNFLQHFFGVFSSSYLLSYILYAKVTTFHLIKVTFGVRCSYERTVNIFFLFNLYLYATLGYFSYFRSTLGNHCDHVYNHGAYRFRVHFPH